MMLECGAHLFSDFWTTGCVRCPDALDKMNERAEDPKYEDVQFISICCGASCDAAREILEKPRERRWANIAHYFMEFDDKEMAKKVLGFKAVPFYVMLNNQGEILQMGNKVNWNDVPGMERDEDKENLAVQTIANDTLTGPEKPTVGLSPALIEEERVFQLDDLDF